MTLKGTQSVQGFCGVPNETGKVMTPDWFSSFVTEVVEGLRWLFQLLSS
jgi:hypothetical protein